MLYGIKNDSSYVQADVSGEQVYISSAYSEKYGVARGQDTAKKKPMKIGGMNSQ